MATRLVRVLLASTILIFTGAAAIADSWPTYRHDPARSACANEALKFPLHLAWVYRSAQPPAPAWGEQLDLVNRVDFDYAFSPVIEGGIVCFASSADDTVRALDITTGKEKWRFTTGGPVRVAPHLAGGRVYFASDDGVAYCVNASDGKIVWRFNAAPHDERVVGNARMISRWPIRSGVLVVDGVAYLVAGMWSMEGVFIYALDAATGKVIWCNDRTGINGMGMNDFIGMGINGHHQGEFGMGGANPQGPLALGADSLLIPNGFAGPTRLDRRTGTGLVPTENADAAAGSAGPAGSGGTWLVIDRANYYTFAKHGQLPLTIVPYSLSAQGAGKPFGPEVVPQLSINPKGKPGERHEKGKVSAIVRDGVPYARKALGIALAGTVLLQGHEGAVVAEETALETVAQFRFGFSEGAMLVHATVADPRILRAESPWKGSCIEVFASQAKGKGIGQVFLLPADAQSPAQGFKATADKPATAPEVLVSSKATDAGYEISAVIPYATLGLDPAGPEPAFEAQVTVNADEGTLQRNTLFGSPSAYNNAQQFAPIKPRRVAGVTTADGVKAAVVNNKPWSIKMRGHAQVWKGALEGGARELAIADGKLFVGTDHGDIYCFAPDPAAAPVTHTPAPEASAPAVGPGAQAIVDQARRLRADAGVALVLGDADASLSRALAVQTRSHVVLASPGEEPAAALRQRLVESTRQYGSKIEVHAVARADKLPFPQFFANTVIAPGDDATPLTELYRVLHPCGGALLKPGLDRAQAEAVVKAAGGRPEEEVREDGGQIVIVRGKLPGALDWDTPQVQGPDGKRMLPADHRVKWPLRPLWWGGPGTLQIRNYLQGADGPCVANGRYFIKSETGLTCVDAYNGAVLWSRPIPQQTAGLRAVDDALFNVNEQAPYEKADFARGLRVNDDSVFLRLGKAYARGKGETVIQLDARTGEQKKISGAFLPATSLGVRAVRDQKIDIDPAHSGSVTLEKTPRGLLITLTTKDPLVTPLDAWDLHFDFRPIEARYGLYERGVFHVRVVPAPAPKSPPRAETISSLGAPDIELAAAPEAGGTRVTALLTWENLEKFLAARPTSFGFSATLNSHDGGPEPIVRRHLFGDWTASGMNNGWASIELEESVAAAPRPSIIADGFAERSGAIGSGGRSLLASVASAPRVHPLTGELTPKVYRPSTLCGAMYFSDQVMTGRAGYYDFDDDSGMRFLGGIKSRCTTPQVVALGLLIVSEETGHCSCNYPYRTTLVLAPAERRLNEDWALFHDREPDTQLRQAAILLGAPGDRRDESGTLWLGFPRPPANKGLGYPLAPGTVTANAAPGTWMRFMPPAVPVPLTVETFGGDAAYKPEADAVTRSGWATHWAPNRLLKPYGPNRVNADRVPIAKTVNPWIYASNYRGIRTATLRLNFIPSLASVQAAKPPVIDGKLDDPAAEPQAKLPYTLAQESLRHDAENLYITLRRPPVYDRTGKFSPWTAATRGDDVEVWKDDSVEFFFSDASGKAVVHLGVSASGARFDALALESKEDRAWNGQWRSAVIADPEGMTVELAIPWKTIESAGLDRGSLAHNFMVNQKDVTAEELKYPGNAGRNYDAPAGTSEALCNLGRRGRARCEHFAPLAVGGAPVEPTRLFTVRLHFAELDGAAPGQRVFDVKLQGQTVAKDVDVTREAGPLTALVREFKHVSAGGELTLEFVPRAAEVTPGNSPILSALEVIDESYQRPK